MKERRKRIIDLYSSKMNPMDKQTVIDLVNEIANAVLVDVQKKGLYLAKGMWLKAHA